MNHRSRNEALINEVADIVKQDKNVRVLCDLSERTTRQLVRDFWHEYFVEEGSSPKGFATAFYAYVDARIEGGEEDNEE